MLTEDLISHLEKRFDFNISSSQALTGGDINAVYLLREKSNKYVLKINQAGSFPGMFQKEANGLKALRDTGAIDVPEVLGYGDFKANTYLVMVYRDTGRMDGQFWEVFGEQLATLHQNSRSNFGFDEDNYIGSLPQYNSSADSAAEFYIQQRLEPQFKIAKELGYSFRNLEAFYQSIERRIPDEAPALIHGDLWSGNYLVNSDNMPCLIDPAVAYASREMDLAMMKLFGGFDESLFRIYEECFPLQQGWKERIPLWQLYHILVHVNLFGGHYYSRAKEIMKTYY